MIKKIHCGVRVQKKPFLQVGNLLIVFVVAHCTFIFSIIFHYIVAINVINVFIYWFNYILNFNKTNFSFLFIIVKSLLIFFLTSVVVSITLLKNEILIFENDSFHHCFFCCHCCCYYCFCFNLFSDDIVHLFFDVFLCCFLCLNFRYSFLFFFVKFGVMRPLYPHLYEVTSLLFKKDNPPSLFFFIFFICIQKFVCI